MLRCVVKRSSAAAATLKILSRNGVFSTRCIHNGKALFEAKPFNMPAMSPTMEKGGIVGWKFKVGEPFSAGDVLLEVETDKAQIDVEAQDDGKIAKIIMDGGSKDVDVGTPIAFIAEPDDDWATLTLPDISTSSTEKKADSPEKKGEPSTESPVEHPSAPSQSRINTSQELLPSVSLLLEQNGISKEEAIKSIVPTGSNGRLLKGDVLAYLGTIPKDAADRIQKYVAKSESLDLSNIEIRTEPVPDTAIKQDSFKPGETKEGATQMAPQQITIKEKITFDIPEDVSQARLEHSLRSYVDHVYREVHQNVRNDTSSRLYDDLFEDLVEVDEKRPRFTFNYELVAVRPKPKYHDEKDIFDLLAGSSKPTSKSDMSQGKGGHREYSLDLTIKVDAKYGDAEKKANKFIDQVKSLQM